MHSAPPAEHGGPESCPPHRAADCDVAVFVAVPEESRGMRARIQPHLLGGDGRLHGTWGEMSVRLQETGPGPSRAEAAARRLLSGVRPRLVICAGVAGGLDPSLVRGAVVVAERVVDAQGASAIACDPSAVAAAVALGARRGVLLTSAKVVCTTHEKRSLARHADIVDMESLAVARVADEHGVPFVGLRVVSDTAHERFPVDLNRYLDARGEVRRWALVGAALQRPGGLSFLLGLRSSTLRASSDLASLIERLLGSSALTR